VDVCVVLADVPALVEEFPVVLEGGEFAQPACFFLGRGGCGTGGFAVGEDEVVVEVEEVQLPGGADGARGLEEVEGDGRGGFGGRHGV
jgi:hypothetical protein